MSSSNNGAFSSAGQAAAAAAEQRQLIQRAGGEGKGAQPSPLRVSRGCWHFLWVWEPKKTSIKDCLCQGARVRPTIGTLFGLEFGSLYELLLVSEPGGLAPYNPNSRVFYYHLFVPFDGIPSHRSESPRRLVGDSSEFERTDGGSKLRNRSAFFVLFLYFLQN